MPRFNPNTYNPVDDSSAGLKTVDPTSIVLEVKTTEIDGKRVSGCPCGCGLAPEGKGRTFRMGHDARFRGKLIRAHATGTKIVFVVDGEKKQAQTARTVAKKYGESFVKALDAADLRIEGKNRELLQKAMGSNRLVKVGRSKVTGQVVAVYEASNGKPDRFDIEYVTKGGEKKTVKDVSMDDAPKATAKDVKEYEKKIAPAEKASDNGGEAKAEETAGAAA